MKIERRRRRPTVVIAILIAATLLAGGTASALYLRSRQGETPSQSQSTSSPTEAQKSALSCVEALPTSTLIGQKIMVAGYSSQVASLKQTFTTYRLGGVIIMDETSAQELSSLRDGLSIAPTIAVDQEGGTVQRYKSQGAVPGAKEIADTYTTEEAYQIYLKDAQYLKSIGITVNFGPVLGVMSAEPSALPDRMYSSDPAVVTQYAAKFIEASLQAGITPVVKHFPGLGSTTTNTDVGSATTDPVGELKLRDIIPYQNLSQYHTDAMISNAIVPGLTNGQPALWSPEATNLLRSEGYQSAVVYTDSLTAKAVPGRIVDAAVQAWQAGSDVALIVQKEQDISQLAGIIAGITEQAARELQTGELNKEKFSESVARILARKGIDPCGLTTQ